MGGRRQRKVRPCRGEREAQKENEAKVSEDLLFERHKTAGKSGEIWEETSKKRVSGE